MAWNPSQELSQPIGHWQIVGMAMAHLSVGPKLRGGTQLLTDFSHYEGSQACLRMEHHPSGDMWSLAACSNEG